MRNHEECDSGHNRSCVSRFAPLCRMPWKRRSSASPCFRNRRISRQTGRRWANPLYRTRHHPGTCDHCTNQSGCLQHHRLEGRSGWIASCRNLRLRSKSTRTDRSGASSEKTVASSQIQHRYPTCIRRRAWKPRSHQELRSGELTFNSIHHPPGLCPCVAEKTCSWGSA